MKTLRLTIDSSTLEEYNRYYFKQHPKAKKEPIKHPYHDSINVWMIMKRPAMNGLKGKWKDMIVWLVTERGYNNLSINRCEIRQIVYYPTDRRHDTDNSVPKFILDGLVEGGMLVDDSSEHLEELHLKCAVDREHPRTELWFYVFDDEDEANKRLQKRLQEENKMVKIKLRLPDIKGVKDFVAIMNRCPADAEVKCGKYKVDAKSIMGIFSLDLTQVVTLTIYADTNDVMDTITDLNEYTVV